jgi:hypothetical protein
MAKESSPNDSQKNEYKKNFFFLRHVLLNFLNTRQLESENFLETLHVYAPISIDHLAGHVRTQV